MMEIGMFKIYSQGWVEDWEFSDAVTEAETLLHWEEGELWSLGGTNIKAILVKSFTNKTNEVGALSVLIVCTEWIGIESL